MIALVDDTTLAVKDRVLRAGNEATQPDVPVRVLAVVAPGETVLGATKPEVSCIDGVELVRSGAQYERARHNLVLPISCP